MDRARRIADRRALVVCLTALMFVPPAVSSAPAVLDPTTEPETLHLSTAAAEATIDLTVPGGAPIALQPDDGPDVLGDEAEGLGLQIEGTQLPSQPWRLTGVDREVPGPGAAQATWTLGPETAPALELTRTFTLRADGAGLLVETDLTPHVAAYVTDYRLLGLVLEDGFASQANLTAHDYYGGADWRDVFHVPRDASAPSDGRAQALTAWTEEGAGLASTMVRRGAEASRLATAQTDDGVQARWNVNLSREIVTTGPIPPYQQHLGQQPNDAGVRGLTLTPGQELRLEPVILAAGADRFDTLWTHHETLTEEGPVTVDPAVTYNTNVWDDPAQPTADAEEEVFLRYYETAGSTPYMIMNRSIFQREVPIADRAGVETFVIDDGWQYLSGDWNPHPAKFPGGFGPERRLLDEHGMDLGLWMSPLEFNTRSRTAHENPEWICHPTGTAMMAYPDQAGFAIWNTGSPGFQDHLVDEIGRLHTTYGADYLKFDFMTWVDCGASQPTTIHEYAMAFRDVLRDAQQRYPELVMQIDETNDNRLAQMASVWHGPSWFHNGDPSLDRQLRILASLAPLVPLHQVGMPAFHGEALDETGELAGTAALWGHPTIWSRLSDVPSAMVDAAGDWFRVYRAWQPLFAGMTLTLEAPSGVDALQRVDPEQGRAFVAAMDPEDELAEGETVTVEAQLPCEGEIATFDPLGRSSPHLLGPQADTFTVGLTLQDDAASQMLVCLDDGVQLAYSPHGRAGDRMAPEPGTVTLTLTGPDERKRSATWLDTGQHTLEAVHAGGEQLAVDRHGRLAEVQLPAEADAVQIELAS